MKAVLVDGRKHTIFHWLFIAFRSLTVGVMRFLIMFSLVLVGLFSWQNFPPPANFILGMALLGIGTTLGLLFLYEAIVGLVSWDYSKTHCPFCDNPKIEFKDGYMRPFLRIFRR